MIERAIKSRKPGDPIRVNFTKEIVDKLLIDDDVDEIAIKFICNLPKNDIQNGALAPDTVIPSYSKISTLFRRTQRFRNIVKFSYNKFRHDFPNDSLIIDCKDPFGNINWATPLNNVVNETVDHSK